MMELEVKGERLLFKAIIDRAVKDAFSSMPNTVISAINKKQARFFLCEDPSFFDYCDFANVSGTRLRRVSKILNSMPDREATSYYRKLLRKEFKNEKTI